jgi:hypothetical protein
MCTEGGASGESGIEQPPSPIHDTPLVGEITRFISCRVWFIF